MVWKRKLCIAAKEEIAQLLKEAAPNGAGLRGNERDGTSSSDRGLKLKKKSGGNSFLKKRGRGEASNEGLDF